MRLPAPVIDVEAYKSVIDVVAVITYLISGQKVMLDRELAELYGVETRVLNQAVRRNIKRFSA